jgi:tetraacyldisaccharide 4'-kinase
MPSFTTSNLLRRLSVFRLKMDWLEKQWQIRSPWQLLLLPLSTIFMSLVALRQAMYRLGWLTSSRLSVPLIVVGNISLGGTGKTPLVIYLAQQLQAVGLRPGVISRGYGGKQQIVTPVFADSNPSLVGDEPVLIAQRTACPVFVGANKVQVGQALLQANPQCNVIISDDGLQHYALQRDVEIATVDATRPFGNYRLLPAGPLRESAARLLHVDAVVVNGDGAMELNGVAPLRRFTMTLHGDVFYAVDGAQAPRSANDFIGKDTVAIAGIGNPQRYFDQLTALGLQFESRPYADHHVYSASDLAPFAGKTILMTEKDAVKCAKFSGLDAWYLPVTASVSSKVDLDFISFILQKLRS